MHAKLKRGSTQVFKIQVPRAEEMAVIMGDNWHHLKKEGDMFIGNIEIQDKNIRVFAKFPGQEQYAGLLEYTGSWYIVLDDKYTCLVLPYLIENKL